MITRILDCLDVFSQKANSPEHLHNYNLEHRFRAYILNKLSGQSKNKEKSNLFWSVLTKSTYNIVFATFFTCTLLRG